MNNHDTTIITNLYSQWKVEVMPICQLENVDVIKWSI